MKTKSNKELAVELYGAYLQSFPEQIMLLYKDNSGYSRPPNFKEMVAEIVKLEKEFAALPD